MIYLSLVIFFVSHQAEVSKSVRVLQEREPELRGIVEQAKSQAQEMDIDEAVTTTHPLYKWDVDLDDIFYTASAFEYPSVVWPDFQIVPWFDF